MRFGYASNESGLSTMSNGPVLRDRSIEALLLTVVGRQVFLVPSNNDLSDH